jgi:hypothetical protein
VPPIAAAGRRDQTRLDGSRLQLYCRSGGGPVAIVWPLPPGWGAVTAELVAPEGRSAVPAAVRSGVLTLELPRGRPAVLRRQDVWV